MGYLTMLSASVYRITGLLDYRIIGLPDYLTTGLSEYRIIGPPDYRTTGLSVAIPSGRLMNVEWERV